MDDPDIIEQLRQAIRTSGLALKEIERRSGVPQPSLSRFVAGQRMLTLQSAAKVCSTLGVQLLVTAPAEMLELAGAQEVDSPEMEPPRKKRKKKK